MSYDPAAIPNTPTKMRPGFSDVLSQIPGRVFISVFAMAAGSETHWISASFSARFFTQPHCFIVSAELFPVWSSVVAGLNCAKVILHLLC